MTGRKNSQSFHLKHTNHLLCCNKERKSTSRSSQNVCLNCSCQMRACYLRLRVGWGHLPSEILKVLKRVSRQTRLLSYRHNCLPQSIVNKNWKKWRKNTFIRRIISETLTSPKPLSKKNNHNPYPCSMTRQNNTKIYSTTSCHKHNNCLNVKKKINEAYFININYVHSFTGFLYLFPKSPYLANYFFISFISSLSTPLSMSPFYSLSSSPSSPSSISSSPSSCTYSLPEPSS